MFQFLTTVLVFGTVLIHKNVFAIINGHPTTINIHPYHITVESKGKYVAGGALFTETRVLTTAKAVSAQRPYQVVGGSTKRCPSTNAERRDVIFTNIHPKYDPKTRDYDVAVLTIEQFPWTSIPKPINLRESYDEIPNNTTAVATGWGPYKCKGLMYVNGTKVPDDSVHGIKITKRMHVFSNNGGKSRPESDDGCPLVYDNKLIGIDINQRIQHGVAYTVYLKVSDSEIDAFLSPFKTPQNNQR